MDEDKSKVWINLLITVDWIKGREWLKGMKRLLYPQHMVEPQYIEGNFEANQISFPFE
jgi:hypothetical protein